MEAFYSNFYSNNIKDFNLNVNEFEQSTDIYLTDDTFIKPIISKELYQKTFQKIISDSDFQKFVKSDFYIKPKNTDKKKKGSIKNDNSEAILAVLECNDKSDFQNFVKSETAENVAENFTESTPVNSIDIATNLSTLTTYMEYNQVYVLFHNINLYINSTNLGKNIENDKPLTIINIYSNNTFNISQSSYNDIQKYIDDNKYMQILSYTNVSKLLIKDVIVIVEKIQINIKDENNKKKRKAQLVSDIVETFQKNMILIGIDYDNII